MNNDSYLNHIYLLEDKPLYFLVFEHVAVVLEDGKWKEISYEGNMVDLPKLSEEEAKNRLEGLKNPDDICKQIVLVRYQKYIEELKDKIDHPKRKVIGWVSYTYIWDKGLLEIDNDDDDWYYAGLIRDVIDHGYYLTGAEYQDLDIEPVFDDYRYMPLSRRGFASVIARSRGYYNPMDYARFTEYDFIDPIEVKRPESGKYSNEQLPLIRIDNNLYEIIHRYIYDFYADYDINDKDLPDFSLAMYFIASEDKSCTYFPGDIISLIKEDESAAQEYYINTVLLVKSFDEFQEFLDDNEYFLIEYDESKIKKLLESGEVILLGLKANY